MQLMSQQPFFVEAYYKWALMSRLEVNWLVFVDGMNAQVPDCCLREDGKAVLNMNPDNIENFKFIDGAYFRFSYRTNKGHQFVSIPAELIEGMFVTGRESEMLPLTAPDVDYSKYRKVDTPCHLRVVR